eukprot:2406958-Amphidinium_carterae.1
MWDTVQYKFLPFLLPQVNDYGETLPPSEWNRVLQYSQVQSLIRFRQIRKEDTDQFGIPYSVGGCSTLDPASLDACPEYLKRYVANDMGFSLAINATVNRRLQYANTHLSQELPDVEDKGDSYGFFIWPNMQTDEVLQVIQYFRQRKWIDAATEAVEIEFYLLNAELGRPRIVQGVL